MHFPKALFDLLADQQVTDIFVNSATEVYVQRNLGTTRVANPFGSEAELIEFAKQAVELGGSHLDYSNPICDVALTHNEYSQLADLGIARLRIHAVLSHGISSQNLLSIRVHRQSHPELATFGSQLEIREISLNDSFVISGGAGAGKTTLLRGMIALRPQVRTLLIEDSPELMPISGHFVSLTSRAANTEGRGEIGLDRLLRESLRMRPQRLVIGEIRGAEVVTLLQALNLGVEQVAFTIHANRASQVKARLLSLWLQAGLSNQSLEQLLKDQKIKVIHLVKNCIAEIADLS